MDCRRKLSPPQLAVPLLFFLSRSLPVLLPRSGVLSATLVLFLSLSLTLSMWKFSDPLFPLLLSLCWSDRQDAMHKLGGDSFSNTKPEPGNALSSTHGLSQDQDWAPPTDGLRKLWCLFNIKTELCRISSRFLSL